MGFSTVGDFDQVSGFKTAEDLRSNFTRPTKAYNAHLQPEPPKTKNGGVVN